MPLRLAFYSDQVIPLNAAMDARVLALIGKARPRIGYVASMPDPERQWFERKRAYYAALGARLGPYVDAATPPVDGAWVELMNADAIHLSGGPTYRFLQWVQRSGLDARLRDYALSGKVLIGISAGAMLMTPSLCTATRCGDDPGDLPPDAPALGLVPFHVWPHFEPEKARRPEVRALLAEAAPVYALPDGSGLVVEGGNLEFIGHVTAPGWGTGL